MVARARACSLPPHGDVETPAFMPVGTQGAVKGGDASRSRGSLAPRSFSSNTYHLYLRPGDDLIARRGGLHRFIGWSTADPDRQRRLSGVQSRRAPDDHGRGRAIPIASRRFRAPADAGESGRHPGAPRIRHRDGVRRMSRAAGRRVARRDTSMAAHAAMGVPRRADAISDAAQRPGSPASIVNESGQAQFGIVQGGVHFRICAKRARRRRSRSASRRYAIGGLSVGEPADVDV